MPVEESSGFISRYRHAASTFQRKRIAGNAGADRRGPSAVAPSACWPVLALTLCRPRDVIGQITGKAGPPDQGRPVDMQQPAPARPKVAETVIESTVKLREAAIGRCCEVLGDTAIEYAELGDYSYLGPGCMIADASGFAGSWPRSLSQLISFFAT